MKKSTLLLTVFLLLASAALVAIYLFVLPKEEKPTETPVAEEEQAIECTPLTSEIIDFETVPGSTPSDGLAINTQFSNDFYITFSNGPKQTGADGTFYEECTKPAPLLAKKGTPLTAFENSIAEDNGAGVNIVHDNVRSEYRTQMGDYILTDDGSPDDGHNTTENKSIPCTLIIDYSIPTYEFSFDIVDIDRGETWLIEALDADGNIINSQIAKSSTRYGYDAVPMRVTFEKQEYPISQIRVMANEVKPDDYSWGLAFDNFNPVCAEQIEKIPLNIDKEGQLVNVDSESAQINYSVTVSNQNTDTVNDVIVVDNLPDFVSSVDNIEVERGSASFSDTDHTITWTFDYIDSAEELTMTYQAIYLSANYGEIPNTAVVYVDDDDDNIPDPDEEDDRDDELIIIDEDQEATISKTHSMQTTENGHVVIYTLNIANIGTLDLTDYSVTDTLDSKVQSTWVSNISDSGSYTSGAITWTDLDITAGGNKSLNYTITIPLGTSGTFNNIAVLYDSEGNEIDRDDDTLLLTLPSTALEVEDHPWILGITLILLGLVVYKLIVKYTNWRKWVKSLSAFQQNLEERFINKLDK